MISQESWYREASGDRELSRILRDLDKLDGTLGQAEYVYQEPWVRERLRDLEKFLDRHRVSPDKLPWWPLMLLRYYQNPNLKNTVKELYQRVYETPFWKSYLAGRTWDSVYLDIQELLQLLLDIYKGWPNHFESSWSKAETLFEKWDREVDSREVRDFQRAYNRDPNEREREIFVSHSLPRPDELKCYLVVHKYGLIGYFCQVLCKAKSQNDETVPPNFYK